jgi:hypothetical protein
MRQFYADKMGRPGLPPGIYFRLLLIGYFEGIDSERGIAWGRRTRSPCATFSASDWHEILHAGLDLPIGVTRGISPGHALRLGQNWDTR